MAFWKKEVKLDLSTLSFELTPDCNLSCQFCYNHWKGNDIYEAAQSSYKKNRKALRELLKQSSINQVVFTGGEPLMAERFSELVLYARMKGITVSIISNGSYAEPEKYIELHKLGVGLFQISLQASQAKIHDAICNRNGAWERTTNTIKTLINDNAEVIGVFVLSNLNKTEVAPTLELMHSLGIRRVMFNRFNIGGLGSENTEKLLLALSDLKDAFKVASDTARRLGLVITSNVCTPICILDPSQYRNISFTYCSDDFSRRPITLNSDGDIRFCNHSPVVLGNIFNEHLREIFTSDQARLWIETTPEYCKSCASYFKCKGGCRAAAEQLGLGLDVDPIVTYYKPRN
jgi:radical SAM protein with 4Fe4S-binding SPASM domain